MNTEMHDHFPATKLLGFSCIKKNNSIYIDIPIEKNCNHNGSLFGGSSSMASITSGWIALNEALKTHFKDVDHNIIIQKNEVIYTKPIYSDCQSVTVINVRSEIYKLVKSLHRLKKATITSYSDIIENGITKCKSLSTYVVLIK